MTGRGYGAGISAIVLALLSWLLGYEVLAVLAAACLLVLGIAALLVIRAPTAILTRTVEPVNVTRGEAATVSLSRRNRSPVPAAPLEVRDVIGHLTIDVTIPLAQPSRRSQASYRFVTQRRGHLTVGPALLSRSDPWGLFRRSRTVGEPGELLVHPRVLKIAAPELLVRLGRDAGAAEIAAGSDRFHTLREYVVGDELRRVHWPSSARTGTLVVKQFVDSPKPRLLLFLDCERFAYPSDAAFEEAVDLLVSLAYAIQATGVPFTVAAGHALAQLDISRPSDLAKLLDVMALVESEARPISPSGMRALAVKTRATAMVAVSGPGSGFLAGLSGLRSVMSEAAVYRVGGPERASSTRRRGLLIHDGASADALTRLLPVASAPKRLT